MRFIKRLALSLAAGFLLLCGGCGWSSAEVQPKWTFAVVWDTRGDDDNVNCFHIRRK